MYTENVIQMACPLSRAFDFARQVEHWPALLPHYRWVSFHRGGSTDGGLVEMAARRTFGRLSWPCWWMSEMEIDQKTPAVRYRHVRGITRGMEVEWRFQETDTGTNVTILHWWDRPLIGRWAAAEVVGPVFVHHIAGQTLQWLKRWAEEGYRG